MKELTSLASSQWSRAKPITACNTETRQVRERNEAQAPSAAHTIAKLLLSSNRNPTNGLTHHLADLDFLSVDGEVAQHVGELLVVQLVQLAPLAVGRVGCPVRPPGPVLALPTATVLVPASAPAAAPAATARGLAFPLLTPGA